MNDDYQIPESKADIAIWGPTGSGKTWLIKAFAKELEWYNENDTHFSYELVDEDDIPVIPKPPKNRASDRAVDHLFRFRRIPKDIKDAAHLISAHSHLINVHDDMGRNVVTASIDDKVAPEAFIKLTESRFVVIILDSTIQSQRRNKQNKIIPGNNNADEIEDADLVDDYEKEDYPEIATRGKWTSEEYHQMLKKLLSILATHPPRPSETGKSSRHVAICLTKMDMSTLRDDPASLLGRVFGREILNLIHSFENSFSIKIFLSSSAGTYRDDDGKIPNFDEQSGELIQPKRWEPRNAVAPFFWIFQISEKERLANKSGKEKYVNYPIRPN